MATLFIVTGDKGGVGKSMTARTLVQYFLDKGIPVRVFELDRAAPDLKRCYERVVEVGLAVYSNDPKLEDAGAAPFNAAEHSDVICNAPAQFSIPFKSFVERNEIIELAEEIGIRIVIFFVSNCSHDSFKLFERSLTLFGHAFPHVFVKNHGMTDDWTPFDEDGHLQQRVTQYQTETMTLPRFVGNRDRNRIDELSLSFGEARNYPDFGSITRQRVKSYLRKAYGEFDRILAALNGGQSHA